MDSIIQIAGYLTVAIATVAAIVSFYHWMFFKRANAKLAKRMASNFFWDGTLYIISVMMGIAGLTGFQYMIGDVAYLLRVFALLFATIATIRLAHHYKRMQEVYDGSIYNKDR